MGKQLMVSERTYHRVWSLKKKMKAAGTGAVIDRLIDIWDSHYRDPKELALEELKRNIDKYHYLFDSEDYELLSQIPSLVLYAPQTKADQLRRYADLIEKNIKQGKL